jgi:hypothetical protein
MPDRRTIIVASEEAFCMEGYDSSLVARVLPVLGGHSNATSTCT